MLNPSLFSLLEKRFGKGNVRLHNENQEMDCKYVADPTRSTGDLRYKLVIDRPGEEYMLCCPFCQDWKPRLSVNHRWGTFDNKTGSKNLWLANCWNENCLTKYDRQKDFYDQVVEYNQTGSYSNRVVPTLVRPDRVLAITQSKKKIDVPGAMWALDHMKSRSPRHAAITYVEDRLWDPTYLGKKYFVSYCLDSYISEAKNRIVAPVYLQGKLVGWQARYIGDAPKGVAKWYTCPGMSVGSCLYNYDSMKDYQTKVIVEGPADVWSFGPMAAGLFNKVMSAKQRKLLVDCFRPNDVCVILLDPAQDDKSKARGEQHHIEKLYDELQRESKLVNKVVKIYLPHGSDPDELDREYMRSLIKAKAAELGLTTTFKKTESKDYASAGCE